MPMLKLYLVLEIDDMVGFNKAMERYRFTNSEHALRTIVMCVHEDCYPGTHTIPPQYKNLAEDMFRYCNDLHNSVMSIGPELVINRVESDGVISICITS